MRISYWSSDVCSADLCGARNPRRRPALPRRLRHRRSALRNADRLLARGRARLLARLLGQPHAASSEAAAARLLYGGSDGRSGAGALRLPRSEAHTSELQSLMRISYAVFCLKTKNTSTTNVINCHDSETTN